MSLNLPCRRCVEGQLIFILFDQSEAGFDILSVAGGRLRADPADRIVRNYDTLGERGGFQNPAAFRGEEGIEDRVVILNLDLLILAGRVQNEGSNHLRQRI